MRLPVQPQLKAQYPERMQSKAMTPPAKHPLMLGDKRDLLERRREELEQWVWRLIATPEIARSNQLKAFLEYGKALQRAQKARCVVGCLCCGAANLVDFISACELGAQVRRVRPRSSRLMMPASSCTCDCTSALPAGIPGHHPLHQRPRITVRSAQRPRRWATCLWMTACKVRPARPAHTAAQSHPCRERQQWVAVWRHPHLRLPPRLPTARFMHLALRLAAQLAWALAACRCVHGGLPVAVCFGT